MKPARTSVALAVSVLAASVAVPCLADEPAKGKPGSSTVSLDADRGSLGTAPPPNAAPSGSSSAPAAPGTTAPARPAAPPATPPAPGSAPAAPQGSSPPGSSPATPAPPGNYPPPGYYPPPGNYPPPGYYPLPGNYPPPGYYPNYPPPVAGPYVVGGDRDYEGGKRRRPRRPPGPPDPLREAKRPAKIAMIVGVSTFGAGWVLSVVHGLLGELVGVDCTYSCTNTDDYGFIYIPLVGPILEAGNHRGSLSSLDDVFLGVETAFQIAGLATLVTGAALWPWGAEKTASAPVSFTIAPQVSGRSTGLSLIGTF